MSAIFSALAKAASVALPFTWNLAKPLIDTGVNALSRTLSSMDGVDANQLLLNPVSGGGVNVFRMLDSPVSDKERQQEEVLIVTHAELTQRQLLAFAQEQMKVEEYAFQMPLTGLVKSSVVLSLHLEYTFSNERTNFEIKNVNYNDHVYFHMMPKKFAFFDNLIKHDLFRFRNMNIKAANISGFDTTKADSFTGMFLSCRSLTQLDISSFTVMNANLNAPSMFYDCRNLEIIIVSENLATYLSGLSSSKTENMFTDCSKLVGGAGTTFNESKIDGEYARIDEAGSPGYFTPASDYAVVNGVVCTTRSATENAISSASDSIRIILGKSVTMDDIGNRDSGSILTKIYQNSSAQVTLIVKKDASISLPTDCSNLFADIDSLVALDLRGFTSSGVQNMEEMFEGCNNLQTINLTSFDTSDTENFESMFANCTNLTTIKVSTMFIIPNGVTTSWMFDGCTSIVGGSGTIYDDMGNHNDAYYARIDDQANGNPGYFTEGL